MCLTSKVKAYICYYKYYSMSKDNSTTEYDYETKEFDHMVYHYTIDFSEKYMAKNEAYFNRVEGRFARIARLPGNRWGVYVREKW